MKKIEFEGYAVSEEIQDNVTIWMKQEFSFSFNDNNKYIKSHFDIDWTSINPFLIKTPDDVKYIDHYYTLSRFLFRCDEEKRHNILLNEFVVKRIFLLDDYTHDRLEKGIYPFCAPCMYDCIFKGQYGSGATLVKCLKKNISNF